MQGIPPMPNTSQLVEDLTILAPLTVYPVPDLEHLTPSGNKNLASLHQPLFTNSTRGKNTHLSSLDPALLVSIP